MGKLISIIITSVFLQFTISKLSAQENRIISKRVFHCSEYTWEKTETTYTSSGVYSHLEENDQGETIEYQLALTIDNTYYSSQGSSSCDQYEWHAFGTFGDFEVTEVSVNGTGTIVAIANDVDGNSNGKVEVYEHTSSGWTQLGQTLAGDVGDVFGYSLSLSRSGHVLAVGAPYATDAGKVRVYEYDGTEWVQLGSTLEGQTDFERFGWDVDLSNDGTILIAGAPQNGDAEVQTGEARVFQWSGSVWEQMGDDLWVNTDEGWTNPDNNGSSVAISGDGKIVMVGARFAYSSKWKKNFAGTVWKYEWNGTSWDLTSNDQGYRYNMGVGRSVAVSEDGSVYVAGGDSDRDNSGIALTNRYQGTLTGLIENDRYGTAVSLNQAGNIVAIGSPNNDDGASSAGMVEIFRAGSTGWEEMGQDLFGTESLQGFGTNLELSGDGTILAIANSGGDIVGAQVYYFGCSSGSSDNCSVTTSTSVTTYSDIASCNQYRHVGISYTESGQYEQVLVSSEGCDSTAVINLSIYKDNPCWTTTWRNGLPDETDEAYILGDYNTSLYGSLKADNLYIYDDVEVTIVDGTSLEVISEITNDGLIDVQSGGSLFTHESTNYSGNKVLVRRNTRYEDGRYSMVGSPVQQSSDVTGTTLGFHVYQYDETIPYNSDNDGLDNWISASSEILIPGRGYTQASQKEIVFEGYPNVGTIEYSGTYTNDDGTNEGYNLISNPYTAALDVSEFLSANTNIESAVYIWDDNGSDVERGTSADYIVANGVATTNTTPAGSEDRYNTTLGTAQGFFVKLTGSSNTTITFNESMRVDDSNSDDNFFREESIRLSRINLTNEDGLFKQTVIAWKEDGSVNELIRNYDAPVFNEFTNDLIYSSKADKALAIQVLPMTWDKIPLGINISTAGEYQISAEGDTELYLNDRLTGKVVELSSETYTFQTTFPGSLGERFQLLSANTVISKSNSENITVIARGRKIEVFQAGEEIRNLTLYTIKGELLWNKKITGSSSIDASALPNGLYLVHDGTKAHKILLK